MRFHQSYIATRVFVRLFIGLLLLGLSGVAVAQPSFGKVFTPNSIGVGNVSTLVFTITNVTGSPVDDLDFVDTLPAGVDVADPPRASSDCLGLIGTLSATAGGDVIQLTDGAVAAFASCTVSVDVTSSTPGTHTNTSGDLTSSHGNSGPATDDLQVTADRPGFSKAFAPDMISFGGRSRLTFTINNASATLQQLQFTDVLPGNMLIADPANATNTCNGTLTADKGGNTISLTSGFLATMTNCTIGVDVTVPSPQGVLTQVGSVDYDNITELFAGQFGPSASAGKASDRLTATIHRLHIAKSFTDDPVPPGGSVTLKFAINNLDRSEPATNISFIDNLEDVLTGLAPTPMQLPLADPCGAGSLLDFNTSTKELSLSGGSLAGEGSCAFELTLDVPSGATPGSYTNETGNIQGDMFGGRETGNTAVDDLFVQPAPLLTKEFTDDPVGAGGSVTLEFTITNTSTDFTATNIGFTDALSNPALVYTSGTQNNICGSGSILTLTVINGTPTLQLFSGQLAAGASCTFTADLNVPQGTPGGTYTNTTSSITGTVNGVTIVGQPATDDLVVLGAPQLTKEFTDDPVLPGGTVTLEFTIEHPAGAPADATAITFTDDLNAALTGLSSTSGTLNDVCGTGSQISGTTSLSFTGGTLAPGDSCSFSITAQVPADAPPGFHTNSIASLTASVSGETVTGPGASDDLYVQGLFISMEFTDDPVIPGETVTLEFTLDNSSSSLAASSISFTDSLSATLSGLAVTGMLPTEPCGAGSSITGTTSLSFTNGSLDAGATCTFSVTLQVPSGAAVGDYNNVTSSLTATIDSNVVVLPAATDALSVQKDFLQLSKTFTDDPVAAGDTVTLEFTLTNLHATQAASMIGFTDDLGAALTGLVASVLPPDGFCGAGSQLTGTGTLTLTNASLAAGDSCSFSATLSVPGGANPGDYLNTTSTVTGQISGLSVTAPAAGDTLKVLGATFAKSFSGPTAATSSVDLEFTITNLDTVSGLNGLGFTDDLEAVLSGLVATGLPADDVCGAGSQLTGSSELRLAGGNLGPSGSCTFSVTLTVPASASAGSYTNTSSELFVAGLPVADPATASLQIEPPPAFAKAFSPDRMVPNGVSTLTFTIDNTASALAAGSLDFTDNLPTGVVVASPANNSTTCTGGMGSFVGGSVSFSGGTVSAGAACTVQVDVTSATPGMHVNTTGDLTSSSGNSGTAGDTLTVDSAPGFSKAFSPTDIVAGGVSTLTFTIDNTGGSQAVTALDFTDNLPAGMTVAATPNAVNNCTGGTLTAAAASGTISYTGGAVPALSSCTISADVTVAGTGAYANTSGSLTSSAGNSGTANATLNGDPVPTFTKAFAPSSVTVGSTSTLTFTITNVGSVAATALSFTDTLPAGMQVAVPSNAAKTCAGGALTASGSNISYSGGGPLAAAANCTVSVDVLATQVGSLMNTSGNLTSSHGNSGTASATLTVQAVAGADGDGDGIGDTVENAAPNGGDGNGDGVQDALQNDVTSLPGLNGQYLTLVSTPALLGNVMVSAPSVPGPTGVYFPFGMLSFDLTEIAGDGSAQVDVLLHGVAAPSQVWKDGPLPPGLEDQHVIPGSQFYQFLFDAATNTGAVIGATMVTLHYRDGQRGDSSNLSFTLDAIIQDPVGLAYNNISLVPAMGLWGWLMLVFMTAGVGMFISRRRANPGSDE